MASSEKMREARRSGLAKGAMTFALALAPNTLDETGSHLASSIAIAFCLGTATAAVLICCPSRRFAVPALAGVLVASLLVDAGQASVFLQFEFLVRVLVTTHRRGRSPWPAWVAAGTGIAGSAAATALLGGAGNVLILALQNAAVISAALWWTAHVLHAGQKLENERELSRLQELLTERQRCSVATRADLAVGAERLRLARDVHDTVAGRLSAMSMLLRHAATLGHASPSRGLVMSTLQECAESTILEVRGLIDDLAHADGDTVTTLPDLQHRLNETVLIARSLGVDISITESNDTRPDIPVATTYVVAHELIYNMIEHGAPCRAGLAISTSPSAVSLTAWNTMRAGGLRDRTPDPSRGRGLQNLRDRVVPLGGWAHSAERQSGQTWDTFVRIPRVLRQRGDQEDTTPLIDG